MADFVVIDSPPLTAVIDALPLAQFADEVLVVVRSGQTRIAKLVHLEEILSNQGAYPSGIVLVGATGAGAVGYTYGYDYDVEPANGHAPQSGRRALRQLPGPPLDPAARQ
jgi:Mrp family chromosome partitioning ATPase